jgi:hypothetical protein
MCTLLTQNICLMCHTQSLDLEGNQIGDAGLTALAKAVESGALDKIQSIELYGNLGDSAPVDNAMKERKK